MHRSARFVEEQSLFSSLDADGKSKSAAPLLMEPRGAGPGDLTVVDGVGSGATTRLQFGVNIIPLQERSGGAITDDAREGNAHSCWGVGLSGGGRG